MTDMSIETTRVSRLSVINFRTYESLAFDVPEGTTVVVGPNGAGKTNLLEAVAFACSGSSPRTASELDCIKENSDACSLTIEANRGDQTLRKHRVILAMGQGKRLTLDDKGTTSVEFATDIPVVTFLPERLLVVRGAPARRRQLLDAYVSRIHPPFTSASKAYTSALSQRNTLLRRARSRGHIDRAEVAPWTEALVEHGTMMRDLRRSAVEGLRPHFARRIAALTGFGNADIAVDLRGGDLSEALASAWDADVRRGSTTVGAHLDDVSLVADGRDMRRRGSTGEQRAALLAWSLATYDAIVEATGVTPVVILDEPWSELDRSRREQLTRTIEGLPQVIASTTEPPSSLSASAHVISVSYGQITPWIPTPPSPQP